MNLVNKQVTHRKFGKGKVVRYNDSYIMIEFPSGNKKFVFPDVFESYLTLTEQSSAVFVNKMLQKKKNEKEERKRKRLKALQNEKQQRSLEVRSAIKRKTRKTRKIHPSSQSVFWCGTQELDSVFSEWNVFTGEFKSGKKKGQLKRLAQIGNNSACLLTARDADEPEKNRRILGAFMVNENFNSKKYAAGYIPAHSEYRLRLSEQEAEKLLFWNYYVNKAYPHRITWNTGRQRYFDNVWMAQILQDIIDLKKEPQEREPVQRFFEYFCHVNQIKKEELPKPNGALKLV